MTGSNPVIGGGGFHHVAIRAHDFDASVKFYTEALGFTEKIAWGEDRGRAIMLDTGDGNYLEIFANDVDGAIERARGDVAGVTVEPKSIEINSTPQPTPVRLAFFKGPDGEIIELFDNKTT